MISKIKYFPITGFSAVMGLTGLTIVFGKFYHLGLLPKILFDFSIILVLALFSLFAVMYGLKMIYYPDEVKLDFNHKIRNNFFSAVSISLILLSVAFYSYFPLLAIPLWWMGVIIHTILTFRTIRFWFDNTFDIKQFNPAWFIPVVGNLLIPINGIDFAPSFISYFYFSIGILFWIILFTLFLYRTIFHDHIPEKFIPTLFILLAPPAIGFVSYMRMTMSWDSFSLLLLFIAYFLLLLLLIMSRKFVGLKFYISWWAFTFPLTAVTVASLAALQVTSYFEFKVISWLLLIASVSLILIVAYRTTMAALNGKICIQEE